MAKRKPQSKRRQPRHKRSTPSLHDRWSNLMQPDARRRKTKRARFPLVGELAQGVKSLACVLDHRSAWRLAIVVAGMMLADDRRTASAWFVAAGVRDDWDCFYDCLIQVGKKAEPLARVVLSQVVKKLAIGPDGRIRVAVDDSPSKRFGRWVEGAGVHHNPTPGPADGEWLYGHNWVTLAYLAQHPLWGVIALPLRSLLYVREQDVESLQQKYPWKFETKLVLAARLVTWCVQTLRGLGVSAMIWIVVDGAYAARPFLDPALALDVVVFSRLRRNAKLYLAPPNRKPGQRGRPRKYGLRIDLAKRAAHQGGWQTMTYDGRGKQVTHEYKTFTALSKLTDGWIRVVILRYDNGWAAYFCTDPEIEVKDILETIAARWAIEESFHDVKEVWGAGEQQVRNVWSNIGCWSLNQWMVTLVELAAWDRPQAELSDRSARPWDNAARRPSHADKRRTFAREMLQNEFPQDNSATAEARKLRTLVESLMKLCA